MESKKEWAFVALYKNKKVKKYVTTCEEVNNYEWITETKFWFRDENNTHCEGIVLAKEDNEQSLREMVTKKNPRCPRNSFNPFPDPNIKPINMVNKWKNRLTTIAMNDFSISENHEALSGKEIPNNHLAEASVKITIHNEENEPTITSKLQKSTVNSHTELRQEKSIGSVLKQLNKDNNESTNQSNEVETLPGVSSEEDELLSHSKNKNIQYDRAKKKTILFAEPEKKVMNHRFVIYPNQLNKNKKEASNKDMVSKNKYNRLLQKYKLLSAIFSAQKNRYRKDLRIQHLAQCLYNAIEERYNKEETESEED